MRRESTFLIVATILIGGCEVGPNYRRPPSDLSPGWSSTDRLAESAVGATTVASASSPAARPSIVQVGTQPMDSWWTSLKDPALTEIVENASRSNLDLAAATARVRRARAGTTAAQAGLFPTANASSGYQFDRANGPIFPVDVGDYTVSAVGFDAAYELDLFGGTRRSIEQAEANAQAAGESRRDLLVSLLAEVCRDYIELRTTQRRAEIARENLQTATDLLGLAQRRRDAGVSSELDVVRARSEVTATAAVLPSLDAQAQQLIHAMGVLLGQSPDALMVQLSKSAPIPQPPERVPIGLPSDLLRRRPDVRRVERDLAAATASIGVAEAQLYPEFSLNGELGVAAVDSSNLFAWSSRSIGVGPEARWLLFDAGRVLADVDGRRAVRDEMLADYKQTILSAVRDVEDGVVAFDRQQDRRGLDRETVESNTQAVQIARDQYANGLIGFLSVLDAERSLFASQDQLAQSDGAIAIDLIAIYKGLGGGWQTNENLMPQPSPFPRPPAPAAQLVKQ